MARLASATAKSRGALHRTLVNAAGPDPPYSACIRAVLDDELRAATKRAGVDLIVVDAGCGHKSPLARFRDRIRTLVGVDLHEPEPTPGYLDEFVVVDLCRPSEAATKIACDLVLANFIVEHLPDPARAFRTMYGWLRPGGVLVLSTVNRRHPFVDAYLSLPDPLRRRAQPAIKASPADAHPLIGACNDPRAIRSELSAAGYVDIRLGTCSNLARAWGRRLPSQALGVVGDRLTRTMPGRRSTIIAVARKPTLPIQRVERSRPPTIR